MPVQCTILGQSYAGTVPCSKEKQQYAIADGMNTLSDQRLHQALLNAHSFQPRTEATAAQEIKNASYRIQAQSVGSELPIRHAGVALVEPGAQHVAPRF
jgi:hypothetical protein